MQKMTSKKNMTAAAGFLLALVFNAALAALCCLLLEPHFRNNDDMLIHLITSGAYGEASEYTGFVNIILSKLLVIMQAAAPRVNWFAVLQFGFVVLALSLFEGLLVAQFNRLSGVVFSCSLSFLMLFRLAELHYTSTAFILSALGLASLLLALHDERANAVFGVFGALFSLVGAMLRFNAFFMASAFVFVPFLLSFFSDRRKLLKALSFFLVFTIAFGANLYSSAKYESNPLTAGWLDFCEDRQQISDYPLPDYSSKYMEYMQSGISENDFLLIEEWLYADRGLFPLETVAAVADIGRTATVGQKLWYSSGELRNLLGQKFVYAFAAVFVGVALFGRKKSVLLLSAHGLVLLAAIAFCLIIGRITPWVFYGVLMAFFVGAAVILLMGGDGKFPQKSRIVCSCVLSVLVLALCIVDCTDSSKTYGKSDYYSEVFSEAAEKFPEDLLICTDVSLMSQRMADVFEGVAANKFGNIYVLGGWEDGLPAKTYSLRQKGISSPYKALVERDDVLLMDGGYIDLVANAVYEKCGYEVGFSVIDMIAGYHVAAATDDMGVQPEDAGIEVLEAAMFGSYLGEHLTSVCVSTERPFEEGERVYIRLSEQGREEGKTYRCKVSDAGTVLYEAVVMSSDIGTFSEYTAQLIVVSENGDTAASRKIPVIRG